MIDFRGYFFAIVSIFFALSIGILVGSLMLGGPALTEKQDQLIVQLQHEFERVRKASVDDVRAVQALEREQQLYAHSLSRALPLIERSLTANRRIWVVGELSTPWHDWIRALPWRQVDYFSHWPADMNKENEPDLVLIGVVSNEFDEQGERQKPVQPVSGIWTPEGIDGTPDDPEPPDVPQTRVLALEEVIADLPFALQPVSLQTMDEDLLLRLHMVGLLTQIQLSERP